MLRRLFDLFLRVLLFEFIDVRIIYAIDRFIRCSRKIRHLVFITIIVIVFIVRIAFLAFLAVIVPFVGARVDVLRFVILFDEHVEVVGRQVVVIGLERLLDQAGFLQLCAQ